MSDPSGCALFGDCRHRFEHVQPRERPFLPQVRFYGSAAEPGAWAKELIFGSFAHHIKILVRTFVTTSLSTLAHLHRPTSTGHSGKHGHEFLEFEYSHGRLRYANNSNYRNDSLIRKESGCTPALPPWLPLIFCSVDWTTNRQGTQEDRRVERNHKVRKPSKAVGIL